MAARDARLAFVLALLLVAAVVVVFGPALENGFVTWDDQWYVLENRHLVIESAEDLLWLFTHSYYWSYIPLTLLSHALDYAVWGYEPYGHHLSSLMLHAVNSVWMFVLAIVLLRRSEATTGVPVLLGAWAAALLFALHPLRTESVAWVSDRKDLLCAAFLFPSVIAYLRSRTPAAETAPGRWRSIALVLFVFALLSKATALMLPLALLVLERLFLDPLPGREALRGALRRVVPFAGASLVVGVIGLTSTPATTMSFLTIDLTAAQKLLLPFHTIVAPLGALLWPAGLGPIYDYPAGVLTMTLSLVIVLLLSAGSVILARMGVRTVLAAWSIYLVMSLPTAMFFLTGIQPVADRYTYLSMVSIMVLAGGGVASFLRARPGRVQRVAVVITLVALCTALGIQARNQVAVWKSSLSLWSHAVAVAPASPFAFNNLGQAHLEAGSLEEATLAFTVAARLMPGYADVYNNLGVVSILKGDLRTGRRYLEQARGLLEGTPSPELLDIHRNLARVHRELGDLDSALVSYRRCIALQPADANAWRGLSELLGEMGHPEESARAAERAATLGGSGRRENAAGP